jgi:hypothetical protein
LGDAIGRYRRLPAAERRLLRRAAVYGVVLSAAIRLVGARALMRWATRPRAADRGDGPRHDSIARTVDRLARCPVTRPCLVRALVAARLASEGGTPSIVLGVRRSGGQLLAHAWATDRGDVIAGGPLRDYAPILSIPPAPAWHHAWHAGD